MAFEKADAFLRRHATAIRVLVVSLILLCILLRVGIAHVQEYNRIRALHEQGWYLICSCDQNVFLMFDAENEADLHEKMEGYRGEWETCVRTEMSFYASTGQQIRIYALIPDDEVRYGKTTPCDHTGFLVDPHCELYRKHAVLQLARYLNE